MATKSPIAGPIAPARLLLRPNQPVPEPLRSLGSPATATARVAVLVIPKASPLTKRNRVKTVSPTGSRQAAVASVMVLMVSTSRARAGRACRAGPAKGRATTPPASSAPATRPPTLSGAS
ncbi:hypothetical protein GCM10009668_28310 [Nocardioides dubius]|uniref:Uncharacterized protein n=1 Tax=Nocardioides dubius TaxID=317019 RepID=A0ABP4EKR0_9ACTN